MGKKSFFSLIFSLLLILSCTVFSADAVFKPGKYLGSYEGYGGPVKVEVTTSKDKIESVLKDMGLEKNYKNKSKI